LPFEKKSLLSAIKHGSAAKWRGICASMAAAVLITGCAAQSGVQLQPAGLDAPKKNIGQKRKAYKQGGSYYSEASYSSRLTERRCLERAMFFESNRSSREGLVAVGTVVMNRVHSSQYPNTICGVVGQKSQFAPGVLTRPVNLALVPDVAAAADAVLRGERSPRLKNAMYFHTAGLRFPYNNMHYVLVAGGNSFYERRRRDGSLSNPVHDETYDVAYAFAQDRGEIAPASAALNGAVAGAVDNVKLASIHSDARAHLLQTGYRRSTAPANAAAAANASLQTVYDRGNEAEQLHANGAAANLASYESDTVPVPLLKASFPAGETVRGLQTGLPGAGGGQGSAGNPLRAEKTKLPHFMPISAPQAADTENGVLHEVSGAVNSGKVSGFSYKAPDEQKVGEVGALLLGNKP